MNKTILIGRLTKDPDLRFGAANGNAVTRFTVAVNRPVQKGKEKEADFIRCIAFGKAGEAIAQYLTKGRQIGISGNIRTGSYEAKDGTKRYTTEVVVETFEFLAGDKQTGQPPQSTGGFEEPQWGEQIPNDGDIPF